MPLRRQVLPATVGSVGVLVGTIMIYLFSVHLDHDTFVLTHIHVQQGARKVSWWDVCFHNGESMREKRLRFALGTTVYNESPARSPRQRRSPRHVEPAQRRRSPRLMQTPPTTLTIRVNDNESDHTPGRKRVRLCRRQLSLLPAGRPVGSRAAPAIRSFDSDASAIEFVPQDWRVVDLTQPLEAPIDFVKRHWHSNVLHYDDDGNGFTCKCGKHISVMNTNYKMNLTTHFKTEFCKNAKKTQRCITSFFTPSQRHDRPDPAIFCRGLWYPSVKLDGKKCNMTWLSEYADSTLYYVSGCRMQVQGKAGELVTISRSVFAANCLGHALDQHNRLLPSRMCQRCSNLTKDPSFKRMVVQAQDPRRRQLGSKLPNSFYSWKQLCILKRKRREQTSSKRWEVTNRTRDRERREARHAARLKQSLKVGDLQRVVTQLCFIRDHGDPETSAKLLEFITTFARKGAQQARVYKVNNFDFETLNPNHCPLTLYIHTHRVT